ncbi:MAG: hypothetical protein LBK46_10425 [Oscillospiraceae bacterium]|jgi:hypothetical protein|nr:hypothetical protein [Oscillospiraceae bacterium]
MNLSKAIDFLLENAGAVIQYRLRKEILHSLTPINEENLLEQIYLTPNFKLVSTYVKPNGYIGSGMHSWDNWRGTVLHHTPLEDGETAARLLSYYAIPQNHPYIINYIKALRDEETLRHEFSYIPPEIQRYENRFIGLNNGNCLMGLVYTMQALLGYGDDNEEVKRFQNICLKGFERVLDINAIGDITKPRKSKGKYNYPYIEADEYFPCSYTLAMLAYTQSWRTPENVEMIAAALNRINEIMEPDSDIHVKVGSKYYAPCSALNRPIRAFRYDLVDTIVYRRILTEIAMLGVGNKINILRESINNVEKAIGTDGILRMDLKSPHNKRYSPKNIDYPTAYVDVRLEPDYKRKYALECDLTFWAVQFLALVEEKENV